MPEVNTGVMSVALAEWVKEVNPAGQKLLVLLIDQAGGHVAKDLKVPEGVVLYPLPPYTPELQPTESTWPLLRESVANRLQDCWESFHETVRARCRWMTQNPALVATRTAWDWIVQAENQALTQYDLVLNATLAWRQGDAVRPSRLHPNDHWVWGQAVETAPDQQIQLLEGPLHQSTRIAQKTRTSGSTVQGQTDEPGGAAGFCFIHHQGGLRAGRFHPAKPV
jgi:hypothetical protein